MTDTTQETQKQKKTPTRQWHAFLTNTVTGHGKVLSAPSQKELKTQLNRHGDHTQILAIVNGRSFGVKVQKSFEFVGNDEVESITAEETPVTSVTPTCDVARTATH